MRQIEIATAASGNPGVVFGTWGYEMVKAKRGSAIDVPEYKVVELATVDDVSIERAINTWVLEGWKYDGMQFAMRESSKRPSMAFVLFTRMTRKPRIRTQSDTSVEVPKPTLLREAWKRLHAKQDGHEELSR